MTNPAPSNPQPSELLPTEDAQMVLPQSLKLFLAAINALGTEPQAPELLQASSTQTPVQTVGQPPSAPPKDWYGADWNGVLAALLQNWTTNPEVPAHEPQIAVSPASFGLPHAGWVPLFSVTLAGVIAATNPLLEQVLGYGPEVVGRPLHSLLESPLERLRLLLLLRDLQKRQEKGDVELVYRHKLGGNRVLSTRLLPVNDPGHNPAAEPLVVFSCLWPESLHAKERHFVGRLSFYETLLASLPAPLVILDAQGRYVFCNPQAIRNPEIREWIIGKTDEEYVAYRGYNPEMGRLRRAHFEEAVRTQKTVTFEERFLQLDGSEIFQLRTHTPVFGPTGDMAFLLGHGMEITELRRAQQELQVLNNELEARVQARTLQLEEVTRQLQFDAFHDALTGLPNRALFTDRLEQAIARTSQPGGEQYAVLFLDTDRFKGVNDTLGHLAGDALLRELAARLQATLRTSDTVARLGGDEFTVLLQPIHATEQVLQIAERIQQELGKPVHLSGMDITVSVSMGIVLGSTEESRAAVDILRDADIAMYRAKAAGRGGYQVFEPQMREQTIRLNLLENELRSALTRDELRVVYQPIVSLKTGQVAGFEALVRWQHPERGFVQPGDFMAVAEESGLLLEIDRWVLRRACLDMQEFQTKYAQLPPLSLSVNFSARHFTNLNMFRDVERTLQDTGFNPRQLNLEITESALLGRPQTVAETLERLRSLGLELHLDDFGTGYSSLSYLHTYQLDTLKIDRSFVQNMTVQASSAELVRTIVAMAKNMSMLVVAEGIETRQHLQTLEKLDCEYGQGYLFSPPVEAAQAWAYALEQWQLRQR